MNDFGLTDQMRCRCYCEVLYRHGILYRELMIPQPKVLTWDPCLLRLPETLTRALGILVFAKGMTRATSRVVLQRSESFLCIFQVSRLGFREGLAKGGLEKEGAIWAS